MPRTPLLLSAAAALAAASIGAAVIGSPVDSAGAAAPFSITKSQFTQVQKTSVAAMKKANSNATAIKALKTGAVAGAGVQGPKGDPGPAGGFDPAKLIRVPGALVTVSSDEDYVSYSVPCPPGTIAISGGWSTSTGGVEKSLRVVSSYPSSSLASWSFRFAYQAFAGTSVKVTPYALCAAS